MTRGGLGMPDPIGHIDFYPNGGNTNPGCDKPMQHYILSTGKMKWNFQFLRITKKILCSNEKLFELFSFYSSLWSTGSLSIGFQQFFSCNHVRSQEFFLESIKSNCSFSGVSCDSYESFLAGHCTCRGTDKGFCLRFGIDALSSYERLIGTKSLASGQPIKAYLMTGREPPFCRSHFKMNIIMSGSVDSLGHGEEIGILTVEVASIHGEKTERIRFSREPM